MPKSYEKYLINDSTTQKSYEKYLSPELSSTETDLDRKNYQAKINQPIPLAPIMESHPEMAMGFEPIESTPKQEVEKLANVANLAPFIGGPVEYGKEKLLGEETQPGNIALAQGLSSFPAIPGIARGIARGIGKAGSGAYKGAEVLSDYLKSLGQKVPENLTGTITSENPNAALQAMKTELSGMKVTPDLLSKNEGYSKFGLEPITPAQSIKPASGQPTPSQQIESMAKSLDPSLYGEQERQFQSLKKGIEPYQSMGVRDLETFGKDIKGQLQSGIKGEGKAGEIIGEFKNKASMTPINKSELPEFPIQFNPFKHTGNESQFSTLQNLYNNAKNLRDLDDLSSNYLKDQIQKARMEGNNSLANDFLKVKKTINDFISDKVPSGKPKEAYQLYAQTMDYMNDILSGTEGGESVKVVKKITESQESWNAFKNITNKMENPEVQSIVKEQYLSDIFNSKNWRQSWDKVTRDKNQAYTAILTPEEINKINTYAQYYDEIQRTSTKTVFPSRTPVGNAMIELFKNPTKIVDLIIGKEAQQAKVIRQYKKMRNLKEVNDLSFFNKPLYGVGTGLNIVNSNINKQQQ